MVVAGLLAGLLASVASAQTPPPHPTLVSATSGAPTARPTLAPTPPAPQPTAYNGTGDETWESCPLGHVPAGECGADLGWMADFAFRGADGACFVIVPQALSWKEAEPACRALAPGGRLACLRDRDDALLLQNKLRELSPPAGVRMDVDTDTGLWIGLNHRGKFHAFEWADSYCVSSYRDWHTYVVSEDTDQEETTKEPFIAEPVEGGHTASEASTERCCYVKFAAFPTGDPAEGHLLRLHTGKCSRFKPAYVCSLPPTERAAGVSSLARATRPPRDPRRRSNVLGTGPSRARRVARGRTGARRTAAAGAAPLGPTPPRRGRPPATRARAGPSRASLAASSTGPARGRSTAARRGTRAGAWARRSGSG